MSILWLTGLLRRRRGRLLAVSLGVALAVSLLAGLGAFLVSAQQTMTARATRAVAVDWQVQLNPTADPAAALATVRQAPGTSAALPVNRVDIAGLTARSGGSRQTTGAAVVLGVPADYEATFPGEIRTLTGRRGGVMVAQQTAANLRVRPGDRIQAQIGASRPVELTVDSVVDLPQANSLFQRVGAGPQAQPVAPPDNVVIVPARLFDQQFGGPGSPTISRQVHVRRNHDLPTSPAAAYVAEGGAARNLEVTLAGAGVVGDNLGAALDAARSDAAYAQILFLFLGAPGAILAGLITASVAGAGAQRRRREQALLRTRGADRDTIIRLSAVEAAVVGIGGAGLGLAVAAAVTLIGPSSLRASSSAPYLTWFALAGLVGAVIALLSILLPVRGDLRSVTVAGSRAEAPEPDRPPWFLRYYLDAILIIASLAVFWSVSRSKYSLVLAPEGVPTIKVSYWAMAAPVLMWIGAALLIWRLTELFLRRGQRSLGWLARPLAGRMSPLVAASLGRQRRAIAWAAVLLALATSFAISTSTFNSTYQAQAEVDARLTNGADVAVSQPGRDNALTQVASRIEKLPGVRSVEPLQHRYAYVGADLQDLYGVRPGSIAAATSLQDAYFSGGTAAQLMQRLARQPDGILVSQETVTDFQLVPGDRLKLRLQDATTQGYKPVAFTYVGIAREFPTAPRDSFLVANADYVAAQTNNPAAGTLLIDTGGQHTTDTAAQVQQIVGPGGHVTDIGSVRGQIGSSLTSVSLRGLTVIELSAAVLLAVAASGLVLGLGFNERRRSYAIAAMLGARRRALSGFITTEAAVLLIAGLGSGVALGAVLSQILAKVLTGVFDPPPAALSVPWLYLALLVLAVSASSMLSVVVFARWARRAPIATLREA